MKELTTKFLGVWGLAAFIVVPLIQTVGIVYSSSQAANAAHDSRAAAHLSMVATEHAESAARNARIAADIAERMTELAGPYAEDGYTMDICTVTCATTATRIQCNVAQRTYSCEVDSAASATIYIGDADVTTSLYRESVAASETFGGDLRDEYCIVASGTQTLHCGSGYK